jgi:peptidoglycan hydrolase-like protein with peptidoglycan-binding domain
MKGVSKNVIIGAIFAVSFVAHTALAQVYPMQYAQASPVSCLTISRTLSVGSRGEDVRSLQRYILTRNYPGAGTWLLTGYFGQATRAGVINMQNDFHLPQTGLLDPQTRAALSSVTCNTTQGGFGTALAPAPTPTLGLGVPTMPAFTQPWSTGQAGGCGWYTVAGNNYFHDCGPNNPQSTLYPSYPSYNYGYPYAASNTNAPVIQNISGPTSLTVNTAGTWIVSITNSAAVQYSTVSMDWGDAVYGATISAQQQIFNTGSQSATFTHAYSQSGTYTIRAKVSNAYGTNTSSVTVQVNGSNTGTGIPQITSINPTYGRVGTQITIYGTNFSGDTTVHFGAGGRMHVATANSYGGGNYVYFMIPSTVSPCDLQGYSDYCTQYAQNVTPGQYQIYISTQGGSSNALTFTVQ